MSIDHLTPQERPPLISRNPRRRSSRSSPIAIHYETRRSAIMQKKFAGLDHRINEAVQHHMTSSHSSFLAYLMLIFD
jgi:hypothetical protein